jgi:predicted phosphate transport protein (TIGR00153 family)
MWRRIFTKKDVFFELIERASAKIKEGAEVFLDLMKNFENVKEKARRIKEIERECDDITHEVFEKLSTTFVTPIDREDIYLLISRMDDVMDMVYAVSERMNLFHINEVTPIALQLSEVFVKSIYEITQAITHMQHLDKAFNILRHCVEVNRLENEGDDLARSAIGDLFAGKYDPVYIIKWKEIYETIERGIDKCEDVANVIESIILKNA